MATPDQQASALLFIGREDELGQLHRNLDLVIDSNQPRFVLIQGDYGTGKTALVEHFLEEVAAEKTPVLIGRGLCSMETELNGLLPFSQLLQSLTEVGIARRVILNNLMEFVKEVAPAWLDILTAGAASATAKTIEQSRKLVEPRPFLPEHVSMQFTNALGQLAAKQAVIAFLDDLQWADASSLNLVFHLSRYLLDRPVLFICTYRPVEALETGMNTSLLRDVRANLIRYDRAEELELHPGIDVSAYISRRYPSNTFSSDFIDYVRQLTQGHPLFLVQLFSFWQEKGVITSVVTPNGQSWRLDQPHTDVFPVLPQLSEVLEERIRLMGDELHEILNCASVEGVRFTAQVVQSLQRLDDRIYDYLETLERRYRLIHEDGTKETTSLVLDFYRFTHRYFREHIYEQLGSGKRRLLHRKVANCLETLYDDKTAIATQLALHFREAHEPLKAARYALLAAKHEQARFAWSEGESWCEFGFTMIGKLPVTDEVNQIQFELLEQSGNGYYNSGNSIKAAERCGAALDLQSRLPIVNAERMAALYKRVGDIYEAQGKYDEVMKCIEQGRQVLSDYAVPFGEARASLEFLWGFMQTRYGNPDLAVRFLRELLADTEKLPQTTTLADIQADISNAIGVALGSMGHYQEAIPEFQKALNIAIELGDLRGLGVYSLNLADNYRLMGDLDQSMIYSARGLEVSRRTGDLDDVAFAQSVKAAVFLALDQPQEAINELTQAIATSEQIGTLWNMGFMRSQLAKAYLAATDAEAAYEQATCALQLAAKTPYQEASGFINETLAEVEAARQNYRSAIDHFDQAITIYSQAGSHHSAAYVQWHLAEVLLQQGEHDSATDLLQLALATFQELDFPNETHEIRRLLDATTRSNPRVIRPLRKAYACDQGKPIITHVDTAIFTKTYFANCMECGFCHDSCCSYGVDVGIEEAKRLEICADGLEEFTNTPRTKWFAEFATDKEFSGGSYTRTQVIDGACVFLNRAERGCLIHCFCLEQGIDFHKLKPMVSCLFPITFGRGLLRPSSEVDDGSLICLGSGPSLYRGLRADLLHYFGETFISELDELEATITELTRC